MGGTINIRGADYPLPAMVVDGVSYGWGHYVGTYEAPSTPPQLPKTGQTTVYTTNDDGTYQTGNSVSPRFTDNGDGTITDNATGLMWAKDGNGSGCNSGNTTDFSGAITSCEGSTLAGHSDWRLPNINELLSIVNWGTTAYINGTYFTNNKSNYYWSSTTKPNDTGMAAMFSFSSGQMATSQLKIDSYYVRAVRTA